MVADHTNVYTTNSAYFGQLNNHVDSKGKADGGNFAFLDGSVKFFAWNGGGNWYTDGHSRPLDSTFHDYNPSGGSRISTYNATGNFVVFNGSNDMNPANGTFVAYNAFRSVLKY
jgi:prepilin-type processing-associated H-X9-DG protein